MSIYADTSFSCFGQDKKETVGYSLIAVSQGRKRSVAELRFGDTHDGGQRNNEI